MPTPSSNQPPDPSSPRSHSFSTCPDDTQQHPARTSWQSHDAVRDHVDMEVQHAASTERVAAPEDHAPASLQGPASEDAVTYDGRPSDEPSSRATTMSPRPQSSATAVTSPIPSSSDADVSKVQEAEIGSQLSRETSNSTRNCPESDILHHAQPRDDTSLSRGVQSLDADAQEDELWSPSMGPSYSSMRALSSSPSSFLRAGSKFHGTQQSERQVYDVQVEIKHVDLKESFLCGYLRIQGLTEDHPTLTTYFEGEIIGTKYSFYTQHDNWGANSKVDLSHWAKFNAFRPFQKQARKGPVAIRDVAQRENIFMRWKEHFLVPDHRVRTITGASFEGFYYICFNQVKGEVSGIYFHSKSEKFQQLELKHVPDRGCFAATEFR
ncbi:hypothetical protein G7046_g2085 [Stylonectria norvegica]|nr:hypothetical protein G7046_g2085 [Stylonectria norvegica]